MTTVLITGANRGLGLEFCRQYSEDGAQVIATARAPDNAAELKALDVECRILDVADPASAESLVTDLEGRAIDVLINNAGVMGDSTKSALDADLSEWQTAFAVNVLGPVIATRALLPNLKSAKRPV
ncbi:MAG: SDR family NAD(P)-dependent oxidoreductase, partial [Pseudomonadota bacterium]